MPQINTLVERAEEVIQRDEKKMKSLEERVSRLAIANPVGISSPLLPSS